jgi:catechol 2,3-dioxygenase-like lactoylglutathione lyase family enzyme
MHNVPEEVPMRGTLLFVTGLLSGLAVHVALAQSGGPSVEMMNHVGINVPNVAEAVTYYTEKMGYREAFRANDSSGQPRLVYMQISRNTFLELQPATAQRPAGFTHYGLVVRNTPDAVSAFRKRGLTVTDANKSDTGVVLANITDPYMGRVELVEITPESMHNKAIQSWKGR